MPREYVTSTSIVWFDPDGAAATLDIAFTAGGVYRYFDVADDTIDGLRAAESKGTYVNTLIKPFHRYRRL